MTKAMPFCHAGSADGDRPASVAIVGIFCFFSASPMFLRGASHRTGAGAGTPPEQRGTKRKNTACPAGKRCNAYATARAYQRLTHRRTPFSGAFVLRPHRSWTFTRKHCRHRSQCATTIPIPFGRPLLWCLIFPCRPS